MDFWPYFLHLYPSSLIPLELFFTFNVYLSTFLKVHLPNIGTLNIDKQESWVNFIEGWYFKKKEK